MTLLMLAGLVVGFGLGAGSWWTAGVGAALGLIAVVAVAISAFSRKRSQEIAEREGEEDAAEADLDIIDPRLAATEATVSVIIPAFNSASWVAQAIDSVKEQSYPYWRCIVVDDGSVDATSDAAMLAAAGDPRIDVLRLAVNSGLPAARNAGLAVATTEFVVFLDADDALLSEALETRMAAVTRKPATGAFGRHRKVTQAAAWRSIPTLRMPRTPNNVNVFTATGDLPFVVHQVMMRRSAALEIGGFDERMRAGCEDLDFWQRSMRSGHEYVYSGHRDCLYFQSPNSMIGAEVEAHTRLLITMLDQDWRGMRDGLRADCGRDLDGTLGEVLRTGRLEMRYFRLVGMLAGAGVPAAQARTRLLDARPGRAVLPPSYATDQFRRGVRRELRRNSVEVAVDEVETPEQAPEQTPKQTLKQRREAAEAQMREAVTQEVATFVELLPERVTPVLVAPAGQPSWAAVVSSASEAAALVAACRPLPDGSLPAVVVPDSWFGSQVSIGPIVESGRPFTAVSLPAFFLQGFAYRVVLLSNQDTAAGQEVKRIAEARGSVVSVIDYGTEGVRLTAIATPSGGVARVMPIDSLPVDSVVVRAAEVAPVTSLR